MINIMVDGGLFELVWPEKDALYLEQLLMRAGVPYDRYTSLTIDEALTEDICSVVSEAMREIRQGRLTDLGVQKPFSQLQPWETARVEALLKSDQLYQNLRQLLHALHISSDGYTLSLHGQ